MRLVDAFVAAVAVFLMTPAGHAEAASLKGESMDKLYQMPEGNVESRWYTFENPDGARGGAAKTNFGRKGSAWKPLPSGESVTLADISGSGTIRRMWFTVSPLSPEMLRGTKLEIFWDGAKTPAVSAPLGDFFCHSLGRMATFESACFSSPEGRSMNCVIPMPFRTGAKVVVTNESSADMVHLFYEIDATVGDVHDKNMLYFHSHWRRENPTKLRRDFGILPQVKGRGRLLGCNIAVRLHPAMTHYWWGEGEVKVYLDGDREYPTLSGTGTEDFIGTGWGQGKFSNAYQGCHLVVQPEGAPHAIGYGFYRLHVPDPVYFHKDIRATIQVIGASSYKDMLKALEQDSSLTFFMTGDGKEPVSREEMERGESWGGLTERIDDYCATAYWYMDKPENGLPPIAPVAQRLKDLP